ncbi:HicB family protein [Thermanaerosceptrum fracticalcis]|jgi:predicted RNase H-like HicB family nuclease|uniref:HicB family protein n=1 Tax=Thermanaerosceptrum fracticalcis TaxID=1712410 RepID=A0A7G6E051_THEFR|nr:type II toxin-antitoxin system HicB family antitoxin [Thermanaerosceptrum fracticalcis]QNB45455.1 HicB family protein [Thermanaerosceptrum fracticalcis]
MKIAYPVILTPVEGMYAVTVPDLNIYTQGKDITEAILMAQDAINMWICFEQDEGRFIPKPGKLADLEIKPGEIKTLVNIEVGDFIPAFPVINN